MATTSWTTYYNLINQTLPVGRAGAVFTRTQTGASYTLAVGEFSGQRFGIQNRRSRTQPILINLVPVRPNESVSFVWDGTVWIKGPGETYGTSNQVNVDHDKVRMATNPILPGAASVTIPFGPESSRPSRNLGLGMIRYDRDTNPHRIEFYDFLNRSWRTLIRGGAALVGTPFQINVRGSTIRIANSPIIQGDNMTIQRSLDSSSFAPNIILDRSRPVPATNDNLGNIFFNGRTRTGAVARYAEIGAVVFSPTNGAHTGIISFRTANAGSAATSRFRIQLGLYASTGTGGDMGLNTINANALYESGVAISTKYMPIWVAAPSTATSSGTAGQMAFDSGFFYVCVATNTWRRVAIAAW